MNNYEYVTTELMHIRIIHSNAICKFLPGTTFVHLCIPHAETPHAET